MCGILGIINYNRIQNKDVEMVTIMQKEMLHRGPDNQSIWNDNSVVFGHNRLSIIDLSEDANQPMLSIDKTIVICFNGEIYNHGEIKKELISTQSFKTDHSDTEVLINAYKEWGLEKALKKLKGMFAFSLYDIEKKTTYIVRDRLGKKPMFYAQKDKKLFFSSEIKGLLKHDDIDKSINDEAIYHYLSLLTVNAPNTFYKNISKLEAGNYLSINESGVIKNKFWNITDSINKVSKNTYKQAVKTFEEKLEISMKLRNVSDVPISIALSGGIDSSLNLYYSSLKNKKINAINLEYDIQHEFNESGNAKKFSNKLKIDYHQIKINQENFEKQLLQLLKIQIDMPFGDPNSVLLYFISKKARLIGSKIILVGEGGDELGGYPIYNNIQKEYNIMRRIPVFLRSFIKYIPLNKPYDFFYKRNIISRRQIHGFTEHEKSKFWKKKQYNTYKILDDLMNEVTVETKDSFLKKVLNIEYKLRLPELILPRVDNPTMAASIEARSPFMDYQLIEYCATLPFDIKMKGGRPKSIIKEVSRGKLPNYIVNGRKVGFGMLLHPFLTKSLPKIYKKEIVENDSSPISEYINKKFLKKIALKKKITPQLGYRMWIIYSLNKWLENQK